MGRSPARPEGGRHERSKCVSAEPHPAAPTCATLPDHMKVYLAKNKINFYIINATKIAAELGLGSRTNTIMQSAFFKIANVIPFDKAVEEMKKAIAEMGFTEMTEIQQKAIPELLAGKEVIAKAPTGTGKTCAFGVPMVQRIQPEKGYVQGVILCPTRELCLQITEELQKLGKYIPGFSIVAVYGGQSMQPQINALRKNPQIVVATPGRLMDHMRRRKVAIDRTEKIVLDEADEMLDMGFYQDVRWILDRVPRTKQMSMFSATISREVMDIGWLYQRDPVELVVEPVAESKPRITQYCIKCSGRERIETLINLLKREEYRRSMVFCNTKYGTVSLVTHLEKAGIRAKCLNGDMEQAARNRIMGAYRNNEFDVLVATDVAARGIDVEQVDAAFNYEIPNENEYYLHRIGRTGRAGREGVSFVFYSENERPRLKTILKYSGNSYHPITVNADGSFTACEL